MRVLVCGGRDYANGALVDHALFTLHSKRGIEVVIQGGASGADRLAKRWAERNGIECIEFPADWQRHGPSAGPKRNAQMLADGRPDGVVAFPGGRGTDNMVALAEAAGLKVWRVGLWT